MDINLIRKAIKRALVLVGVYILVSLFVGAVFVDHHVVGGYGTGFVLTALIFALVGWGWHELANE